MSSKDSMNSFVEMLNLHIGGGACISEKLDNIVASSPDISKEEAEKLYRETALLRELGGLIASILDEAQDQLNLGGGRTH